MIELITVDTILSWLEESVEQKKIIDSHTWVDACQKLNILLGDEHEKLFKLQQQIAKMKVKYIEKGDPVSKAKIIIEATDEYRQMQSQKAKIGRVEEAIRISKIQSRLKDTEMRRYN